MSDTIEAGLGRRPMQPDEWLPEGCQAAVCLSIDDVHPATSRHEYEAGGDLGRGALRHLEWLLQRHPQLAVTLFVTPDWREISPAVTRRLLARVPFLRDRVYLTRVRPKGTMRLDRHPAFVEYLRNLPRTEIGIHGLHHVHRGPRVPVEFQGESVEECQRILREAIHLFQSSGLPFAPGLAPPAFGTPRALLEAMVAEGMQFIGSARDLFTPVHRDATCQMSGLQGVSLILPDLLCSERLVHIPTNVQATTPIDRVLEIVEQGGVVSIKAHIIKNAAGHIALDGLDELYGNYLDLLFASLHQRFGAKLWWTTMGEISARVLLAQRSALPI